MQYKISVGDEEFDITKSEIDALDCISISDDSFHIIYEDNSYICHVLQLDQNQKRILIQMNGEKHWVEVSDSLDQLIEKMGLDSVADNSQKEIKAPMPGLILDILVKEGQTVSKDDNLVILEAMKMENILKAEADAVVKKINMKKGESVEKNQILIELE